MTDKHKVTLLELRTLAGRVFRDGSARVYEAPRERRDWGWSCHAVSDVGELVGLGSRMAARRQLRDLLRLLAGVGDLRTLAAIQPGRELSPPERFQFFKRGFRDGVAAVVKRHPEREDYERGYVAGRNVSGAVLTQAAREFGYDPSQSILRSNADEPEVSP